MGETFLDSPTFAEFLRGIPSPTGCNLGDLGDLGELEDIPYVILELPSVAQKQLSQHQEQQPFIPQQTLVVQEQPFITREQLSQQQPFNAQQHQPLVAHEQQPFSVPPPLAGQQQQQPFFTQEQPFVAPPPLVGQQQQPSTALQAFYEADFLGTPEEGYEHIKQILGVQSFKVMGEPRVGEAMLASPHNPLLRGLFNIFLSFKL